MEVQYIVAIVTAALFGLLFLVWLFSFFSSKAKHRELFSKIFEMYNDSNLERIDYDFGYNNETSRIVNASRSDGQMTIDDVMFDAATGAADEGMEEITGNYKPD